MKRKFKESRWQIWLVPTATFLIFCMVLSGLMIWTIHGPTSVFANFSDSKGLRVTPTQLREELEKSMKKF
ncbi:hypothetical protein NHP200010_00150 [Helicobacter bizzozeronii]|uniref:hypothetical protein n=1 Tax=Helicobacter bizzozeronii TaxID=56877 RepID=UPI00244D8C2B|nr:hypothetical protein [Helicobacter bizzozeronii]GMB92304.1 hypothetical protein NHP200010_00150 [Helicobacter bizzozeronii]